MVEGLQAAAPAVVSAAWDEKQGECGGGLEPLTEDMLAKLENLDCSKVCIEFISEIGGTMRKVSRPYNRCVWNDVWGRTTTAIVHLQYISKR